MSATSASGSLSPGGSSPNANVRGRIVQAATVSFGLKTKVRKQYVCLTSEHLCSFESEKKYLKQDRPKLAVDIGDIFNVNLRTDVKGKQLVCIFSTSECYQIKCENADLSDMWLSALLSVVVDFRHQCNSPPPATIPYNLFLHCWDINIVRAPKIEDRQHDVSLKYPSLFGAYRLCFCHTAVVLHKRKAPWWPQSDPWDLVEFPLFHVANYGLNEKLFFLRVGSCSLTGSGHIWMQPEALEMGKEIFDAFRKIAQDNQSNRDRTGNDPDKSQRKKSNWQPSLNQHRDRLASSNHRERAASCSSEAKLSSHRAMLLQQQQNAQQQHEQLIMRRTAVSNPPSMISHHNIGTAATLDLGLVSNSSSREQLPIHTALAWNPQALAISPTTLKSPGSNSYADDLHRISPVAPQPATIPEEDYTPLQSEVGDRSSSNQGSSGDTLSAQQWSRSQELFDGGNESAQTLVPMDPAGTHFTGATKMCESVTCFVLATDEPCSSSSQNESVPSKTLDDYMEMGAQAQTQAATSTCPSNRSQHSESSLNDYLLMEASGSQHLSDGSSDHLAVPSASGALSINAASTSNQDEVRSLISESSGYSSAALPSNRAHSFGAVLPIRTRTGAILPTPHRTTGVVTGHSPGVVTSFAGVSGNRPLSSGLTNQQRRCTAGGTNLSMNESPLSGMRAQPAHHVPHAAEELRKRSHTISLGTRALSATFRKFSSSRAQGVVSMVQQNQHEGLEAHSRSDSFSSGRSTPFNLKRRAELGRGNSMRSSLTGGSHPSTNDNDDLVDFDFGSPSPGVIRSPSGSMASNDQSPARSRTGSFTANKLLHKQHDALSDSPSDKLIQKLLHEERAQQRNRTGGGHGVSTMSGLAHTHSHSFAGLLHHDLDQNGPLLEVDVPPAQNDEEGERTPDCAGLDEYVTMGAANRPSPLTLPLNQTIPKYQSDRYDAAEETEESYVPIICQLAGIEITPNTPVVESIDPTSTPNQFLNHHYKNVPNDHLQIDVAESQPGFSSGDHNKRPLSPLVDSLETFSDSAPKSPMARLINQFRSSVKRNHSGSSSTGSGGGASRKSSQNSQDAPSQPQSQPSASSLPSMSTGSGENTSSSSSAQIFTPATINSRSRHTSSEPQSQPQTRANLDYAQLAQTKSADNQPSPARGSPHAQLVPSGSGSNIVLQPTPVSRNTSSTDVSDYAAVDVLKSESVRRGLRP